MTNELREELENIISGIENTLFMATGPTASMITNETHLKGCIAKLEAVKEQLQVLIDDTNKDE